MTVVSVTAANKLHEEGRDVGVMADDHHVLVGGGLVEKTLELWPGGVGGEGVGDEDGSLVAGLCADELGRLETALERTGDDEIEVDGECVEDVRELQALTLAVFVERTFDVNGRIGAARAGTGVAKKEQVHARSLVLVGTGVGSWWKTPGSGSGSGGTGGSGSETGSRSGALKGVRDGCVGELIGWWMFVQPVRLR